MDYALNKRTLSNPANDWLFIINTILFIPWLFPIIYLVDKMNILDYLNSKYKPIFLIDFFKKRNNEKKKEWIWSLSYSMIYCANVKMRKTNRTPYFYSNIQRRKFEQLLCFEFSIELWVEILRLISFSLEDLLIILFRELSSAKLKVLGELWTTSWHSFYY